MNSVLNPEAPEFYPNLTSFTQTLPENRISSISWGGYMKVNKSIKSSNILPAGKTHDIFKTFTDFNVVSNQLSENVVLQSNQIISTELPAVKLKRDEHQLNAAKLADVNDSILHRINTNIDAATGVSKSSDTYGSGAHTRPHASYWNPSPVIAKIQVGSATFIGAKNIPRPQLNFKDTIDNSDSLWVPKISDKPNSIKPLALNILYNEDGAAVGYEHPYQVELEQYRPPSQFIDPMEPLEFPAPVEETFFTYVNTEAKLNDLVEHLNTVTELAIDLEHHSYRTYQGITCLIQVTTTEGGDFIIDALAIREHIHKLNLAFTDPKKLKVFHGAEHDVIWLQRDFGVYLVGMFDTHQAALLLRLPGLSLKFLLSRYCQVNVDKKYQLADWRMRPLPAELIHYARMDTHYLLYIWRQLKLELTKDGDMHKLLAAFEKSRRLCTATYNKQYMTESSHFELYLRSRKKFNTQQMAALKLLYRWRDAQARALDESTTYLLPNHMLLGLAENLPREVQGVTAVCQPMPPFVKQNLITIHRMILSCREMPNEPYLYKMPDGIRNLLNAMVDRDSDFSHLDMTQYVDFGDEISMENEPHLLEENTLVPDIDAFLPSNTAPRGILYSELNAEAKLFFPPYLRYQKYRILAQQYELVEYRDKVAKFLAISKGNELIQKEVLIKLHQVQSMIHKDVTRDVKPLVKIEVKEEIDDTQKTTQQRKRKISAIDIKQEPMSPDDNIIDSNIIIKEEIIEDSTEEINSNVKPFAYKHADYKKFFNQPNKDHKQKQPKMKFKKYKK